MPKPELEKIELVRMELPSPAETKTPSEVLKAIVLAAPLANPPTILLELELTNIPLPILANALVPVASVPIKLPSTVFDGEVLRMRMPSEPLPEIRFRDSTVVPPMRLLVGELEMAIPRKVFGRAAVPAALVPM